MEYAKSLVMNTVNCNWDGSVCVGGGCTYVKVLKKAAKEIVTISIPGLRFEPGTTQNETMV
jgi:hypothetical protein